MAKEGLLNEDNWIHKEPKLSKTQFELRQRLWISKDQALKKSTNLYVSKTRLQVRNLPRREFFEKEMKELMKYVAEEWSKTLSPDLFKSLYKGKKTVLHIKIMKDGEKTDSNSGESLGSGQGFVELSDASLALYAVHYLNNYELVPTKGLIVDYSMEDQRALFKRKQKIDRWRDIAKQRKEGDQEHTSHDHVTDLTGQEQPKTETKGISEVEDIETLKNMLANNKLRGKRQRLTKKIQKLEGTYKQPKPDVDAPLQSQNQSVSAKDKITQLLKKREEKLAHKEKIIKKKGLSQDEKKIKDQIKDKKRKANKVQNTDEFDSVLEKYQSRMLKKVKNLGDSGSTVPFQEVDVE